MWEDYSDMTICHSENIFPWNFDTARLFRKPSRVFEYFGKTACWGFEGIEAWQNFTSGSGRWGNGGGLPWLWQFITGTTFLVDWSGKKLTDKTGCSSITFTIFMRSNHNFSHECNCQDLILGICVWTFKTSLLPASSDHFNHLKTWSHIWAILHSLLLDTDTGADTGTYSRGTVRDFHPIQSSLTFSF